MTSPAAMERIPHGEQVSFAEFCDGHGITLAAHERAKDSKLARWYVSSKGLVEIREGGFLTSTHGNGDTPDEALADYARRLAGHRLLIGGLDGHEAVAPNEWVVA